ncbi:MAG: cytochrome b/b6 domain-containing protein [Burkholderiales bacterium]|nr:cytochrome b/b6 domain-containing protein [Burkholderiales bacterium]
MQQTAAPHAQRSSPSPRRRSATALRDNGLRFSPVTIALHWLVAALVLSIIVIESIGLLRPDPSLVRLENLLAALLLPISAYRFWARVTSYHPLPLGTPNPVEVIVSRSVAIGLALAMVLLPIAAWLCKSAADIAIELPGGYVIPALMAPSPSAAGVLRVLFDVGGAAFLLGLALHLFGALKNHFVLKNDVLKRMLGKHVEL